MIKAQKKPTSLTVPKQCLASGPWITKLQRSRCRESTDTCLGEEESRPPLHCEWHKQKCGKIAAGDNPIGERSSCRADADRDPQRMERVWVANLTLGPI